MADPGKDAGIRNLVAVEVQDRQNNPIGYRIQKLVGVPARGERAGFRFAVTDDAGDDQVGVVVSSPVSMRESVAKLATLVNRTRGFRRHMAGDSTWEGELREK